MNYRRIIFSVLAALVAYYLVWITGIDLSERGLSSLFGSCIVLCGFYFGWTALS